MRVFARWGPPAVLMAVLCCDGCAPPPMKLPDGRGAPAPDAVDVLREATQACQAVSSLTAEVSASGSAGGHRLRARLLVGLAVPALARLEAVAPFGPPVFLFVARDNEATLLLPRDRRMLAHERPATVLEAVAGVPLDAVDLRMALTGCAAAPRASEGRQLGEDWRVVPDGPGDVYLHREAAAAPWRLVAAVHREAGVASWRSEYRDFQHGGATDRLPSLVRLTSVTSKQFDLQLTLSQVELNAALDAEVFEIPTPAGAETMTLEELKRSGPLSSTSGGK